MTTIFQKAIERAWKTGHFWSPNNPEGQMIDQSDLKLLHPTDDVAVQALISMAKSDAIAYTTCVLNAHGRLPDFDGIAGPAMESFIAINRCPVPDFAPPKDVVFSFEDPDLQRVVMRMQADGSAEAIGSGNWQGCHNIGKFHSAIVNVNLANLPSFLKPVLNKVLANVQQAYAAVGLLFRFVNAGRDMLTGEANSDLSNTDMSFVNSSTGWIGLAIVGQNETCSSRIWCKFLSTYRGGSNDDAIVQQWTTLIKHELGHNCGRGHTNGGVMNPSLVNGLPTLFATDDPSLSWLKQQFGGVPVNIPGGNPLPPSPNPPVSDIEQRFRNLELKYAIQEALIRHLLGKIK